MQYTLVSSVQTSPPCYSVLWTTNKQISYDNKNLQNKLTLSGYVDRHYANSHTFENSRAKKYIQM